MALFKIREYIDNTNLREVTWQHSFLTRVVEEHKLSDGECVVYENAANTKARLVANVGGMPMLFLPPIDPQRQLTIHLEVNLFLRGNTWGRSRDVSQQLSARMEDLEARLLLREEMKKRAAARRKGK